MGVWEFVVVYLAAFVLVQLVIYRYLRDRSEDETRVAFAGPSSPDRVPHDDGERREHRRVSDVSDGRIGDQDAVRRCPHCGASNDHDEPYTFCRNCANRLHG